MEARTQDNMLEAAPLLRTPDAGPEDLNKAASNGTFADSRDGVAPDGPPKPVIKMAALLPALAIGVYLVSLDQTLTLAAYGKMTSELQALNSSSWIATSYFLTVTTSQPLFSKLSDIFGRKPVLLSAYVIFALGTLGCGLARDITELCLARALSGVGGGGMNVSTHILVTDLVSLRDRGVWQGYINILYALGTSTGGPIGGLFADSIGWRWAFILQCPIAFLAFMSVYLVLHSPRKDHSHWISKFLRIDFIGVCTFVPAIFLLLFGLDNGSNEGWSELSTIAPLALAPVVFAIFVFVEAKIAKEPFAPGHVVFHPPLLTSYAACSFGLAGQMSIMFFVPLFFQGALGMSASLSGLLFVPCTVLSLSGSLGAGLIIKRTGRYYWLNFIGHTIMILGVIPLFLGVTFCSVIGVTLGLGLIGFAACIFVNTSLISVIANAVPSDTAIAIGSMYLFRSLGTTIGISVTSGLVQQMLRVTLTEKLGGEDRAREIQEQVRLSLDYIRTLEPDVAIVVRQCYRIAIQWSFVSVVGFGTLAFVGGMFIREKKLER